MSVMARLKDLGAQFARATTSMHESIVQMRAEIAERGKQIEFTHNAVLPRAEIIATRIPGVVERTAALWLRDHGTTLVRRLGDPATEHPSTRWPTDGVPWGFFCAAVPELAAQMLTTVVRTVGYTEGQPSSERSALIQRLTAELDELDRAEEALVDEAVKQGVMITHRDEVVQRRDAAASERRRQEEAASNRQTREAAINERHQRDRSTLSPYVTGSSRVTGDG